MDDILQKIKDWFLFKKKHFEVFAEMDTRLEEWLKAELIVLLKRLMQEKEIENFNRETKIYTSGKRKSIDFTITLNGVLHLCEIKAICISQAAGTSRNLHFYFSEHNKELIKDLRKLNTLPYKNKWVIAFIYPKPNYTQWVNEVSSLPNDLTDWECITNPSNFPDFLFISVWRPKNAT